MPEIIEIDQSIEVWNKKRDLPTETILHERITEGVGNHWVFREVLFKFNDSKNIFKLTAWVRRGKDYIEVDSAHMEVNHVILD
ncbi:MAG: hypothetical protein ACYTBJ_18815 [Planctomycetota bacterium]|jgi:hypothetical protein